MVLIGIAPNGIMLLGNNFNIREDASMNRKNIFGVLMGCFLGATVGYSASVVSVPHTFTAGTAIKASEVNANFVALSQRISDINIKSGVNFNRSSSFSEGNITPVSASIGSIITNGSKSYIIKQISGIEDPITGKVYTVKYPAPKIGSSEGRISFTLANCQIGKFIVKGGFINGANAYVSLSEAYYNENPSLAEMSSNLYIEVGNLCGSIFIENNAFNEAAKLNNQVASGMADRATDLMKYIVVQGS